jgi:hypothetical protein
MLKQADNERVTRSGPDTPLGRLMRAYWQPAALVSEMSADRPVKAVRLLGEDLVLFGRYEARRGDAEGEVVVGGQAVSFGSPAGAKALGIG